MPAPIAPLIGFVFGIAFAWAAAGDVPRAPGSVLVSRALVVVSLFGLLVFAPIAAYFVAFAPDWSFAYLVDSGRLPGGVDFGVILLDVASVPLGFAVASRRCQHRSPAPLLRLATLPALLAATFFIAGLPRLQVDATYAQYHGDFGTQPVAGSPLGYALLWMNAVLLIGTAWTIRALRRMAARGRRR